VIHSAALIMIFVFGSFALNGERMVVMFGIGLAAAVALDAFLLRSILVPALMYKFGRANWYLPGWLGKILPHVTIEPPEHEANALAGPEAEKAATARPAEPVPDEYVHGLAHPDPYEEPAAYEDAWADPYTQPHPDAPDAAPQTDPFADAHDDSGAVPYVPQGGPAAGLFLQGAVRSPEGAPVVGAALALISQSGRLVDHTVSDPHGMYALAVPGAEEYILAVTAEGYDPQITPLAVGDGSMEHWIVLGVRGDQNSEPVQNYF
jgi:RND superfamily putative drug exporter